jgi:hypothetical protein
VTGALAGCHYPKETWIRKMNDIPNFAAWSNENLSRFAEESYRRMQDQQEAIMQLQGDLKDAMVQLRKLLKEKND